MSSEAPAKPKRKAPMPDVDYADAINLNTIRDEAMAAAYKLYKVSVDLDGVEKAKAALQASLDKCEEQHAEGMRRLKKERSKEKKLTPHQQEIADMELHLMKYTPAMTFQDGWTRGRDELFACFPPDQWLTPKGGRIGGSCLASFHCLKDGSAYKLTSAEPKQIPGIKATLHEADGNISTVPSQLPGSSAVQLPEESREEQDAQFVKDMDALLAPAGFSLSNIRGMDVNAFASTLKKIEKAKEITATLVATVFKDFSGPTDKTTKTTRMAWLLNHIPGADAEED